MPHPSKSVRLTLVATLVAVNLMMVGGGAYTLNEAKRIQETEVRTTTENMTLLIDQNISEVVRNVDLSLLENADYLERELRLRGHLNSQEVNDLLSRRMKWDGAATSYHVTDASGTGHGPLWAGNEGRQGSQLCRPALFHHSPRKPGCGVDHWQSSRGTYRQSLAYSLFPSL